MNGTEVTISSLSPSAMALGYGIAVSGSDVYVAGQQWDSTTQYYVPYYWKNGVGTALPATTTEDGIATSIAVVVQ
jgi:hypothetical protein